MPKLIILRGNSGSGKSTTARLLRDAMSGNVALVEQDYIRRTILKEKEDTTTNNVGLIAQTVSYALSHGYDTILEGILRTDRYADMIRSLMERHTDNHVFYFDISFEETLRRHETKPNSHEFGEKEMREWYRPQDLLGTPGEIVLGDSLSQQEILATIQRETTLSAR